MTEENKKQIVIPEALHKTLKSLSTWQNLTIEELSTRILLEGLKQELERFENEMVKKE